MLGSKLDILKQEWIDVVFTGRNKAYGAYELRKSNPRNTNRALAFGIVFFVLVISLKTIINIIDGFIPKADEKVKMTDVILAPPPPEEQKKVPPPPPPEPPKPKIDQVKFPPLVVKPDVEVKEDPPTQEELKVADPGPKDQKGDPNAEIRIDEPVGNSDIKQVTEDENKIFVSVESSPEFPGGAAAFTKYLEKNIKYPGVDRENNVSGKVFISFVVEKDGSLTDISAVRGPSSTLKEEAVRILSKSPKWKAGIQNGRPVRVQYTVPINFTLGEEQ
ncbi:energy transducer TonB [Mucilaginibacter calamicampi]|uniref:Energy transducer TonB n=1 Tax=Mucilaginibacter calamicampi TaxID=1302352 RepID=A0ABW2YZ25_9SPHI